MNLVLRNNMLTCTLLGIRESLRRLVHKRKRATQPHDHSGQHATADSAPPRAGSAGISISTKRPNASTLADLYSTSPINPIFKTEEGTVIDMRSSNEESDSDIDTFVITAEHDIGTKIHVYNQLYNLRRGHYFETDKFKLDPHAEKVKDVVLFSSHFGFVAFAPKVFHNIRIMNKIPVEDYMETMAPISFLNKVMESEKFADGGRSGSFFVRSPCRRFIVKTIPSAESEALLKVLPWYYEHLHKYPKSLLVRIYGLYKITVLHTSLHVVVMSNLFSSPKYEPHDIFDLKGSFVDRKTSANATVKKDQDLQTKLRLDPTKRQAFLHQLGQDVKLLRDLNIMDYSLLLGIHYNDSKTYSMPSRSSKKKNRGSIRQSPPSSGNIATFAATAEPTPKAVVEDMEPLDPNRLDVMLSSDGTEVYSCCVIDILQPYNASKKRERFFKVWCLRKNAEGISAVPPYQYCRRFRNAMSDLTV